MSSLAKIVSSCASQLAKEVTIGADPQAVEENFLEEIGMRQGLNRSAKKRASEANAIRAKIALLENMQVWPEDVRAGYYGQAGWEAPTDAQAAALAMIPGWYERDDLAAGDEVHRAESSRRTSSTSRARPDWWSFAGLALAAAVHPRVAPALQRGMRAVTEAMTAAQVRQMRVDAAEAEAAGAALGEATRVLGRVLAAAVWCAESWRSVEEHIAAAVSGIVTRGSRSRSGDTDTAAAAGAAAAGEEGWEYGRRFLHLEYSAADAEALEVQRQARNEMLQHKITEMMKTPSWLKMVDAEDGHFYDGFGVVAVPPPQPRARL